MVRTIVRWAVSLTAYSALAGCGGEARDGGNNLSPGELGRSGGAAGAAAANGGSNAEGPFSAGGSGAGGLSSNGGAPSTGGAAVTVSDGGSASPGYLGSCQLLGPWHTHSQPWNGLSTDATITFASDGTLVGEPYFTGKWSLDGTKLSIWGTTGQDMTCDFPDDWTLTFSQDCNTAPLIPIGSGCTGARRYLDWDVTLSRS